MRKPKLFLALTDIRGRKLDDNFVLSKGLYLAYFESEVRRAIAKEFTKDGEMSIEEAESIAEYQVYIEEVTPVILSKEGLHIGPMIRWRAEEKANKKLGGNKNGN
jgi:hypothetical protein